MIDEWIFIVLKRACFSVVYRQIRFKIYRMDIRVKCIILRIKKQKIRRYLFIQFT